MWSGRLAGCLVALVFDLQALLPTSIMLTDSSQYQSSMSGGFDVMRQRVQAHTEADAVVV